MATAWHKLYLPEIHDLYPGMEPGDAALAAEFPMAARTRIAWSIVPNWQGRRTIAADPAYAAALCALPGIPVLHGWTHSLGPDLLNWLLYGHDNRSEFRRLGRADAQERIAAARAAWESAFGRPPAWFCAPRWQLSRAARAVLRETGFVGTLDRTGIEVFGEGSLPMDTLNFDEGERRLTRLLAAPARQRKIRALLATGRPFRLVIHPDDLRFADTRSQLRATVASLEAQGWRPVSLDAAIELWRAGAT